MDSTHLFKDRPEWALCFDLAVEAFAAGSVGIAAVIVDQEGAMISKGRNQLRDSLDSCNSIKRTPIAHAEINAINAIPLKHQQRRDLTIYTTVEPCPMCLGALVMSSIRRIRIASRDPYAGSIKLLEKDWYLKKKGMNVKFERGKIEEVFFILHYLSMKRDLSKNPDHLIFRRYAEYYSAYLEKIDQEVSTLLSQEEISKEDRIIDIVHSLLAEIMRRDIEA